MTKDQLKELLDTGNPEKIQSIFDSYTLIKDMEEAVKQYFPEKHGVMDQTIRPKKMVKDTNGNDKPIEVARLTLPIQKNIVTTAAAFLGTPLLESSPETEADKTLVEGIKKVSDDNKMDYRFKSLVKYCMAEKQSAELWYTQEDPEYWSGMNINTKFKLRMRTLAHSLGDTLYPIKDVYGDLICFARGYSNTELINEEVIKITHFEVYTDEVIYEWRKQEGSAWEVKATPNAIGKIPVIYYSKPFTEWHDVQSLIDRLEKKISNHADTNDYYDSPIVKAKGHVDGFADKGETGKFLEMTVDADVTYLTWDSAPESMKMEIDNLLKFIHKYTHTPDISFENMKGLGQFSGIALKMLFLDAHLKASDNEEVFGEGVQRRINYIKHALITLDGGSALKASKNLTIKPVFKYFLPENIEERVSILANAVTNKLMSRETAVALNPLVEDVETEAQRIKDEAAVAQPVKEVIPAG